MSDAREVDCLLVGTADRESAVSALGEHFAAGRLELSEYEDRLGIAIAARTRSTIRALFEDLPAPHPPLMSVHVVPVEPGRLPDRLRSDLVAEGLHVLDEDVPGSLVDHRRASGWWGRRDVVPIFGSVAVSRRRVVVWVAGAKRVDLPFGHPLWSTLRISAERGGRLRMLGDLSAAVSSHPAEMELVLRTEFASTVVDLVAAYGDVGSTGRRRRR